MFHKNSSFHTRTPSFTKKKPTQTSKNTIRTAGKQTHFEWSNISVDHFRIDSEDNILVCTDEPYLGIHMLHYKRCLGRGQISLACQITAKQKAFYVGDNSSKAQDKVNLVARARKKMHKDLFAQKNRAFQPAPPQMPYHLYANSRAPMVLPVVMPTKGVSRNFFRGRGAPSNSTGVPR